MVVVVVVVMVVVVVVVVMVVVVVVVISYLTPLSQSNICSRKGHEPQKTWRQRPYIIV